MPQADEPEPLRRALQLGLDERYAEAVELLRGYLTGDPGNALGWRRLAGACIGADHLTEAQQAAEQAIACAPENPAGHRLLGVARYFAGDHRGAADAAREALRRDDGDPEAHALHAMALLRLPGGWEAGRAAADRAVSLDRGNRAAVRVAAEVRALGSARRAALLVPAASALAILLFVVAGLLLTGGSIPRLGVLLVVAGLAALGAGMGTLVLNRRAHPAAPPTRELLAVTPGASPPLLPGLALSAVAGAVAGLTAGAAGGKPATQLGIGVLTAAFAVFLFLGGQHSEPDAAARSPAARIADHPRATERKSPAAAPSRAAPAAGAVPVAGMRPAAGMAPAAGSGLAPEWSSAEAGWAPSPGWRSSADSEGVPGGGRREAFGPVPWPPPANPGAD